jgi:hypothetical protein
VACAGLPVADSRFTHILNKGCSSEDAFLFVKFVTVSGVDVDTCFVGCDAVSIGT